MTSVQLAGGWNKQFSTLHGISAAFGRLLLFVTLSLTATILLWAGPVEAASGGAPTKKECSQKYVDAQQLRGSGKLVEAKGALLFCAQDGCPAVLRRDCVRWLDEVEKAMPSIVLGVRDPSGNDILEAQISIDGREIENALDGRAIDVDPGKRVFRVEVKGWKPVERVVIIREGEKNRLLTFQTESRAAVKKADEQKSSDQELEEQQTQVSVSSDQLSGGSRKTWAYVSGGIGVVSLAVGGYFGYAAAQRWSDRNDHCPNSVCDDEAVAASDDAHRDALIADIGVGLGLVGVGVGAYLWFTDDGESEQESGQEQSSNDESVARRIGWGVTPMASGGGAVVVSGVW